MQTNEIQWNENKQRNKDTKLHVEKRNCSKSTYSIMISRSEDKWWCVHTYFNSLILVCFPKWKFHFVTVTSGQKLNTS